MRSEEDFAATRSLVGVCFVLGAASSAATYKVCFRRRFGDAAASFVMIVLAILGVWTASLGSALLWLVDGDELSEVRKRFQVADPQYAICMHWLHVTVPLSRDMDSTRQSDHVAA